MKRTQSTDGDRTGEQSTSNTATTVPRRRLLAAGGTVAFGGCLGFFDGGDNEPSPESTAEEGTYTTVPGTTTFSYATGSRTPYPSIRRVEIGSGDLLLLFFDYAHDPSIQWWRETYPQIRPLVRDGQILLRFGFYPTLASKWSVMVPCALLEVKHLTDNETAVQFHDRMIEIAPEYSLSALETAAEAVGVEPTPVRTAASDRRRRDQVFTSKPFAEERGVETPPAIYTGDEMLLQTDADKIRNVYGTETAE